MRSEHLGKFWSSRIGVDLEALVDFRSGPSVVAARGPPIGVRLELGTGAYRPTFKVGGQNPMPTMGLSPRAISQVR